jgi:hypothetical protein
MSETRRFAKLARALKPNIINPNVGDIKKFIIAFSCGIIPEDY